MSFLSVVGSEIKKFETGFSSFYSAVKNEFTKLFKQAPSFDAAAAATITYVAPLVESIVTFVDPAVEPVVASIVAKVQSALAAAAVVIKSAGSTPTLLTYLNSINSDITQIEAAAQIKDAATADKLTAITGTITGEIDAIISEIQAAPVSSPAASVNPPAETAAA
jgi:hypothetical protein